MCKYSIILSETSSFMDMDVDGRSLNPLCIVREECALPTPGCKAGIKSHKEEI